MKVSQVREALRKIITGEVLWEKEILNYYSVDASSYQIIPKVIVIPKNETDVINLVKFAKKIKMPVTVRGAGTGLVGSALNDGIIVDLKYLSSIKIEKNFVTIGGGVLKGMLDKKLKEKSKFFPPNPSVGAFCGLGGMLGNNSSGSRSLKYGSVIDNVKEITFVTGKGEKITLPNNKKIGKKILELSKEISIENYPTSSKNSSGYRLDAIKTIDDTQKIVIGSEGTLGIILSAKLKIKNIPKKRILCIVEYKSIRKAAKECNEILKTNPSAIEFVDKITLKQIPQKFNQKNQCLFFVEYDSDTALKIKELQKIVTGKISKKITKETEIQKWWRYRDSSLYYSLKSIRMKNRIPHIIEDAAVPIDKFEMLFSIINKLNQKFGTRAIMYGHAGNANIHVRLIADRSKTTRIKEIAKYYFTNIVKMKGTISAEHGDGLARSEYVKFQYGQQNYDVFSRVKKVFDPQGILNPGKIISTKSTIANNFEKID